MSHLHPRHQAFQKATLVATAFLVFWIYLGALINFHQHHIFGHTLISMGIVNKREETLLVSHEKTLPFFLAPALMPDFQSGPGLQCFNFTVNNTQAIIPILQGALPCSPGLRAPPAIA
ncbi:MAG: hypothetical protein PHW35_11145 [Lentimicrobiaceae bacterium]|nr:hypothetical protein [Lentimicrobiaceae bacterium]MDD4598512.1 hypothetical protein [Lentimicrobiaceae bacterium]